MSIKASSLLVSAVFRFPEHSKQVAKGFGFDYANGDQMKSNRPLKIIIK